MGSIFDIRSGFSSLKVLEKPTKLCELNLDQQKVDAKMLEVQKCIDLFKSSIAASWGRQDGARRDRLEQEENLVAALEHHFDHLC